MAVTTKKARRRGSLQEQDPELLVRLLLAFMLLPGLARAGDEDSWPVDKRSLSVSLTAGQNFSPSPDGFSETAVPNLEASWTVAARLELGFDLSSGSTSCDRRTERTARTRSPSPVTPSCGGFPCGRGAGSPLCRARPRPLRLAGSDSPLGHAAEFPGSGRRGDGHEGRNAVVDRGGMALDAHLQRGTTANTTPA